MLRGIFLFFQFKSLILCGRDWREKLPEEQKREKEMEWEKEQQRQRQMFPENVCSSKTFRGLRGRVPRDSSSKSKGKPKPARRITFVRDSFSVSSSSFSSSFFLHFYCLLNLLRFVCSSLSLSLTLTRHSIIGITKAKVKVKEEWRKSGDADHQRSERRGSVDAGLAPSEPSLRALFCFAADKVLVLLPN